MKKNFCPTCGAKSQPQWQFCAQCGVALTAEGRRFTGRSPVAGLAIFCALALVGLGTWNQILRTKGHVGTPGSPAGGLVLPEGHPPIDRMQLPEEVREFIAGIAAEAREQPGNAMAWERLSEVQRRAARVDPAYYPDALESYRHLLELTPEHPAALRGLASVYYELTDYRNAQPLLERYLTLEPNDPGAETDLATVRLHLGDSEQAIADYRKVIAANPQFVYPRINLGAALHQLGKDREALEVLRQAREVAPDDPTRMRVDELIAELGG